MPRIETINEVAAAWKFPSSDDPSKTGSFLVAIAEKLETARDRLEEALSADPRHAKDCKVEWYETRKRWVGCCCGIESLEMARLRVERDAAQFSYDLPRGVVSLFGTRFSDELLRNFQTETLAGECYRHGKREDGVVAVTRQVHRQLLDTPDEIQGLHVEMGRILKDRNDALKRADAADLRAANERERCAKIADDEAREQRDKETAHEGLEAEAGRYRSAAASAEVIADVIRMPEAAP